MTQDAVWEAEFSCSSVGIPPAVAGVDLVTAGGLRGPRPVVPEPRPEQVADRPEEVGDGVEELALG